MNPASGLYDEFKWEVEDSPTPSLSASHIRDLMETATTTRERLLVVALAGWGLRANEVAALHISQFQRDVPDDDVPFLTFENRKNGPGEVSLLFGLDVLDSRIDEQADDEEWMGYLFPSTQGETPHVTRDTIRNWFQDLASKAGLPDRIEGERPSPQLCRRFWYETYTAVLEGVLEGVEDARKEYTDVEIRVENTADIWVMASDGITYALDHAIANAIEHNDRTPATVAISIEWNPETGHGEVHIADNGPEIPEQEIVVLKEGAEVCSTYHGTGVGLWVMQWCVDSLGGELKFEENHPCGNVITIVLPQTDAPTDEPS